MLEMISALRTSRPSGSGSLPDSRLEGRGDSIRQLRCACCARRGQVPVHAPVFRDL